jgi:hypothetical protein
MGQAIVLPFYAGVPSSRCQRSASNASPAKQRSYGHRIFPGRRGGNDAVRAKTQQIIRFEVDMYDLWNFLGRARNEIPGVARCSL